MLFLGQLILFRPKIFGQNDGVDFFLGFNQEPFFFFFANTSFFPKFWGPLPLEGLRQWSNWPSGRAGKV